MAVRTANTGRIAVMLQRKAITYSASVVSAVGLRRTNLSQSAPYIAGPLPHRTDFRRC
jgi:hypothetical protein